MQVYSTMVLIAIAPTHFKSCWPELLRVLRVHQAQDGGDSSVVDRAVYSKPNLILTRSDFGGLLHMYDMINQILVHMEPNAWPTCDIKTACKCALLDLLVPTDG